MSFTPPPDDAPDPGDGGAESPVSAPTPTVSFVLIAFNEASGIGDCLESLASQEAGCDAEYIVIDDASTDETRRVVERFAEHEPRVRLVALATNQGRGAARAAGVAAARGEYVAFVDADIVLPPHWLTTVLECLQSGLDACGGIAVPDGDVSFLFNRFGLRARAIPPAATITGSNGVFRRSVFDGVGFSSQRRNGEDVHLVRQMERAGLRMRNIPDLIVDHRETKSFRASIGWLFESGVGANAEWRVWKRLRTPDLAFGGLLATVLGSAVAVASGRMRKRTALAAPVAYVGLSAGMHLWTRFDVRSTPMRSLGAWTCNCALITSYYVGRLRGLVSAGEAAR